MDDAPITPLAVPSEAGTLIVFGGTFDPPHVGHVRPVLEARTLAALDDAWLVYVPTTRSPHKQHNPMASDADRLAMLELALAGVERAAIWGDELDRAQGEPTYTIDTLRRLRRLRPGATLRLLIGADQALALHRWREPREIVAIAPPLIMLRGGVAGERAALERALGEVTLWNDAERTALRNGILEVVPTDASGTQIRAILGDRNQRADPAPALVQSLRPGVLAYLLGRTLYERPDWGRGN